MSSISLSGEPAGHGDPRVILQFADDASLYRGRLVEEDGQLFAVADDVPGFAFSPERIQLDRSRLFEIVADDLDYLLFWYRDPVQVEEQETQESYEDFTEAALQLSDADALP